MCKSAATALLYTLVVPTGYSCCCAVGSHAVDLAKLQHVMTGQSQRSDSAPHVLVFIGRMKVANSMASHKKLVELFQVTMVCHKPLQATTALVCALSQHHVFQLDPHRKLPCKLLSGCHQLFTALLRAVRLSSSE